jgi:putative peptide zinc metalloprotease protein
MEEINLLKLRTDLLFTYQDGNDPYYLIEDQINSHYFKIGIDEYNIIRKLDGKILLTKILQNFPQYDQNETQQLVQWLIKSQLVYIQNKHKIWQLLPNKPIKKLSKYLNLLFIKISFGSPDYLLDKLLPYFRWLIGFKFLPIYLIIIISGLYQLFTRWQDFTSNSSNLLSNYNTILLVIAWIIIKAIHELFHGLVCKKYHGYVHEAGIMLILFAPLGGYINATSSWKFSSKWQRIHVAIAGIYSELLIAAISIIIWVNTDASVINYLAYNLIIIAGIGTLLFNINPLMRFDVYYILSDLLDISNLATNGQRYIHYLGRRYILGYQEQCPYWYKMNIIKIYAFCSLCWRILVMISLLLLAKVLLHGAGIILSIIGLISWLGLPAWRIILGILKHQEKIQIMRRLIIIIILIASSLYLSLTELTWSRNIQVPAVLDYADLNIVKAESMGFVDEILVKNGDYAKENQILIKLKNKELLNELHDLELQLNIHSLKQQQYMNDELISAVQLEQEKIKELNQKLLEIKRQVTELTIKAPINGYVIAKNLYNLLGVFLKTGSEILSLTKQQELEIKLSIPQHEIDFFRAAINKPVTIYLDRQPNSAIIATLDKVNPAATQEIQHPALTALTGGRLNVQAKPASENKNKDSNYQYLKPRFKGIIKLNLQNLKAGETAYVILTTYKQSLWQIIINYIKRNFK